MGKEDSKCLNYIGIVRLTDNCLLSSYPEAPPKESRKEIQPLFDKIFKDNTRNIKNNTKKYLNSTTGKLFFLTNSNKTIVLFVYSKDAEFPKRLASKLLKEFAEGVDEVIGENGLNKVKKYSLSTKLRSLSIELLDKYQNYKKEDPTTKVKQNVDGVLDHFNEDVNKLLESYVSIEDLKSKSVHLQEQAAKFSTTSSMVKQTYKKQYLVNIIVLGVVLLVIALYFIIPLLTGSSETPEYGPGPSLRGPSPTERPMIYEK